MATATEKDDFDGLLNCTICLETYKDPRYLPCLHTYCEGCIRKYIVSSKEKGDDIKCPVCRKGFSVEKLEEPQLWTEKLPKNDLICTMIDMKDITRSEKLCNACQISNVTNKATSWCTVCFESYCNECTNHHRKFRATLNHKIIELDELKSADIVADTVSNVTCDEHRDKTVDVYCIDHSKPCCTICATIHHRKCDNVIGIEKAVAGVKTSDQTTELRAKLKDFLHKIDSYLKNNTRNIASVQTENMAISEDIDNLTEILTKHLSTLCEKLKNELTAKKKEVLIELEDDATELSSLKSTINTWTKIMDMCVLHGSDLQCLIEVNRIREREKEMEFLAKRAAYRQKMASLRFDPDEIVKNFPSNVSTLGKLIISGLKKDVNMKTGMIKSVFSIEVSGISSSPCGSGLFLDEDIILTDHVNCRVIKYTKDGVIKGDVKIPGKPYDITKVGGCIVAVGIQTQIVIVDLFYMTLKKTVTAPMTFCGLQYADDQFILAYSKTLMRINETTGTEIEDYVTNGQTFFLYARDRKEIIYGDGTDSVSRTVNGETKFTYRSKQLRYPRGIDVDFEGNIYICCYRSKNIHQITEDGELVRIISTVELGITSPWIIRFEPISNRFLLTDLNFGKVVVCEIV